MAFDSRLPVAYHEDDARSARSIPLDHLKALEYAEPHPIQIFFERLWQRIVTTFKIVALLSLISAYPAAVVLSNHIDDSDILLNEQPWAFPEAGVAITSIARELEAGGWAADRANWHPQARLTAMPAWQEASADGLAEFSRLVAGLAVTGGEPDEDLTAASRLLQGLPGEDMRPRLTAAAEALNRFDSRVSRKLVAVPERKNLLLAEAGMIGGWAEADQDDLSTQISREKVEFPASKQDIRVFYAAKARAHIAHQVLLAAQAADPALSRDPEIKAALEAAIGAWSRAGRIKPLIVSNQTGDSPLFANHLAALGFYLHDAQAAAQELVEVLKAKEGGTDEVAALESPVIAAQ